MKLRNKIMLIIVCAVMAILLGSTKAKADQFSERFGERFSERYGESKVTADGVWQYSIMKEFYNDGNDICPIIYEYKEKVIAITDCNDQTSKELSIPNEIDGIPVAYVFGFSKNDYACEILNIPSNVRPYAEADSIGGIDYYNFNISSLNNCETVNVALENKWYESEDGVVYNKKGTYEIGEYINGKAIEIDLPRKKIGYYPCAKKEERYTIKYGTCYHGFKELIKSGTIIKTDAFYRTKYLKELVIETDDEVLLSNLNSIKSVIVNKNCKLNIVPLHYNQVVDKCIYYEKKYDEIICNSDCEIFDGHLSTAVVTSNEDLKKFISIMYVPEGSEIQKLAEEYEIPYKLLSEYNGNGSNILKPSQDKNYTNLPSKTINNQKYITGISLGKNTVNEILSSSNFTSGTTVKAYKYGQEISGNEKIGTGTVVKVYENGEEKSEYVAVVYGDTDGDGDMTAVDALAIVKNKTGEVPFTTDAQKEAAKISTKDDGEEAGAVDALAITLIIIGKANWNEKTGSVEYVGQSDDDDVVEAPTVSIDHELTLKQQSSY